MLECPKCGHTLDPNAKFCRNCGASLTSATQQVSTTSFMVTTTPTVAGNKIKKVIGVVTGLTLRTRGVLGKFKEVSAFITELEKANAEAIERAKSKALALGANAIIGLDVETSNLDLQSGIVVFSATATAVILEPEQS